ncbi:MAG TPA: hypothetical protein VHZ74_17615 [Bryobacteraceae bacterium]|jgi:uncharacterized protein YunC (DUF1805 family)|nr:hypothetical protein [Bryobacteraceae bacterium]
MSITKNDVKRGIDKAASNLKTATDVVAAKSATATSKAKELGRNAGDQMIAQGKKLKSASR